MLSKDPITFEPLLMERVWGGRRLETVLGKGLPPGVPIGESWELVDREEAQSVVADGPLRGATLHELWTNRRAEIFGPGYLDHPSPRFPLLAKVLDARERLSVQVHPPAAIAPALHGEPKTEMWYFLDCLPPASVYAGLRRGVTRASFDEALDQGNVEPTLHQAPVRNGESIFIPSGRVHAIGEGCLIIEIQQNSDTTYRVFDWNRAGLDGKRRALHPAESLLSIDFADFEPDIKSPDGDGDEVLSACEHFLVERWTVREPRSTETGGTFALFTVVEGRVRLGEQLFEKGAFFLCPAGEPVGELHPLGGTAAVLRSTVPLPRHRATEKIAAGKA